MMNLLALLLLATLDGTGASLEPVPIDPPAPAGSSFPAIASEGATTVSKGHDLLMTWWEPKESGGSLRFARFSEGTWTRPVTIVEPVSILDPADRPSLTVFDTQGVRRTLIARTGDVIARSGNAGWTWARLPAPPLPFASFAGGEEGGYAFWPDTDPDGSTKLLGSRILAGGTTLDPGISDTSGTAAAMTWDGPVVVYRDRGTGGAQNLAVVRRQEGRWTPPQPVFSVDRAPAQERGLTPQVAVLRRHVAVVWYAKPKLFVAFSEDAGKTFGDPIEVDSQRGRRSPAGSVDIAVDDNGDALVLWTTTAGDPETTLHLARVSPDGKRGEDLVLTRGRLVRDGGIPQLTRVGPRVAATWVGGDPERIRAVAVSLAGIPAEDGARPEPAAVSQKKSPKRYFGRGRVGDTVPDHEVTTLEGDAVSLSSLSGRPVLLNLWATWCIPCLKEMPELASLHEHYGSQGLEVVGLSVDEKNAVDKVHAFVAEREIPFPVWLDPEMLIFRAFRIRSLPVTFVIDREGRILWRHDGVISAEDPELEEALRAALKAE